MGRDSVGSTGGRAFCVEASVFLLSLLLASGCECAESESSELLRETEAYSAVLLLGAKRTPKHDRFVLPHERPSIKTALQSRDTQHLHQALRVAGVEAVAVVGEGVARSSPFALGELRQGFRGHYLSPKVRVLELWEDPQLPEQQGHVLGEAARRMLLGQPAGALASALDAPAAFKGSPRPVEVMLIIRVDGEPRLWRSTRGASIPRALIRLIPQVRQRWKQRGRTLGGPLVSVVQRATVEVHLLIDDGTLGSLNEAFLTRVVTPEHGVGYEYKGSWHYLPSERVRTFPNPTKALSSLLSREGLSELQLRPDVRYYRFRSILLGSSLARADASEAELTKTHGPQN